VVGCASPKVFERGGGAGPATIRTDRVDDAEGGIVNIQGDDVAIEVPREQLHDVEEMELKGYVEGDRGRMGISERVLAAAREREGQTDEETSSSIKYFHSLKTPEAWLGPGFRKHKREEERTY
jgi:hypothetical protein